MTNQTSNNLHANRGYLLAVVSAFFLSTTSLLIRFLTLKYELPALILAFWRDVFVFASLFPVLFIFRSSLLKLQRRHVLYLILYGFVLAIFNSLWTLSVALNGAAVATVMVYCSAAFTALLGRVFLKESLGWGKLIAVALSLGGCLLVSGALSASSWQANLLGIFTGILAGLSYAIYSLMGRSASQRGLNPWTTLLYTFGFAAVFLLGLNLIPGANLPGGPAQTTDLLWSRMDWAGWLALFILAAGPTLLGFGTYNMSLSFLPSSIVNLVVTLEPVFTTVTAFLIFGERLTLIQLAGGILIVGGVVVIRLTEGLFKSGKVKKITQASCACFEDKC